MLRVIGYFILFYLAIIAIFYLLQRQFIYLPHQTNIEPHKWGLPQVQLIQLKTSDGYQLNSWYFPAEHNKPTIVYFHGNAGSIAIRAPTIAPYITKGYGVLLLGYRGYSQNSGWPSEQGLYRDGRAAIEYLMSQNISPKCMVLYGESLGTGVAVHMATEHDVGALVLQSAYSSLVDLGRTHYGFLPINWLLKDRYESIAKIQNVHAPILFLHGRADYIVPLRLGKKLYDKANQPKDMTIYPRAGHNDMPDSSAQVMNFLEEHKVCKNDA